MTTTAREAKKDRVLGAGRIADLTLGWVARDYPNLSTWRDLAVEWLKMEPKGLNTRLRAFNNFFDRYLIQQQLPVEPEKFLSRDIIVPDFYATACPHSAAGVQNNNIIRTFLDWVLLCNFSVEMPNGQRVVLQGYDNPVPYRSHSGLPKLEESVHSPLPYGYIDELRQMIASGKDFKDWAWAQQALGAEFGPDGGRVATDWFPVTQDQIDENDPDCVWYVHQRAQQNGGPVLKMWSPVRWVALLVKLIIPLRTYQVRMLDSGEADTWRYESGNWVRNESAFAERNERRPLQQGVFRRPNPRGGDVSVPALLYINTNKTADIGKSGSEKGYILPWIFDAPLHQNLFYWLEKLRNWQGKYNPVSRRTAWNEMDGRHLEPKSDVQLASYPDACFLFRLAEDKRAARHLPVVRNGLNFAWYRLLERFEQRLADRGETHANGDPIRLMPAPDDRDKSSSTTFFPLHSLRVSLVTALALDGQVPFPILQKLVGHSRLLMTLYYVKPGATHINEALEGAAAMLEENKGKSIERFLTDTEHSQLLEKAICNSSATLAIAIPEHPAARNPVGWMHMHHGLCMVGGNTSEIEGNAKIGGCYNGGPNIGSSSIPKYAPVPGGDRNCVRCRWFVTDPCHLPALNAHFNNIAYHLDEARNKALAYEETLQELKRKRAQAEDAKQPFLESATYRETERLYEGAMKNWSNLAEDSAACIRLIKRCETALKTSQGNGTQLVAVGTVMDVQIVFEGTDSELLQLSGICEDAEVYPDLDPGKAVLRRSQLLDNAFYRDGLHPFLLTLCEEDQQLVGNAVMRRLAHQADLANPILGKKKVISLIDAGQKLSEHLGTDLTSLLESVKQVEPILAKSLRLERK